MAYVSSYEARINAVGELVEPKSETVVLKAITDRIHHTMDGLLDPINRLIGYIELTEEAIHISTADFGLVDLRKGITTRDAEHVVKTLHTVNLNIAKYKDVLVQQGMRDWLVEKFQSAAVSVADDKQKQYEITSNRKNLVQNNVSSFNELYKLFNEILKVGKILYKGSDAAKLKDYTFNELKKGVARTAKSNIANPPKVAADVAPAKQTV